MFWWRHRSPTDDRLLTQLGTPASLAWLLVVSALAKLLDEACSLEEFLEAAQSRSDRLSLVDTDPNRHESPFKTFKSLPPLVVNLALRTRAGENFAFQWD